MKALISYVECEKAQIEPHAPVESINAHAKLTIEVVSTGKWDTDENGYLEESDIKFRLSNAIFNLLYKDGEPIEF